MSYWFVYIGIIIIVILLWRAYRRSEKGGIAWDRFKLKMPIVGKAIKMTAAARFTRTMSTLLRSGLNVLPAMEITSSTLGNRYLVKRLTESRTEIRKGVSLSRAIRGITELPPMVYAMVATGEESGTLDTILDRSADFFDEEADAATAKMTAAMEPIMIIIMAVVVLLIVAACGAPILQMTRSIM